MPYLVVIACCLSCNLPLVPSVVNCPAAIKPLILSRSSTEGGLVVVVVVDTISDKSQIGLFKKVGATSW